jgi:prepilin peptidase CpaA
MAIPVLVAAGMLATAAAGFDLRSRRIPNWLTATGCVGGLLLNFALGGVSSGLLAFSGALLGFALLAPFFLLRAIGAGDVKLLAALGAILGPHAVISVWVYGAIVGGLISLFALLKSRRFFAALTSFLYLKRLPTISTGITAPYALALAGGVYLAALLPPVWR